MNGHGGGYAVFLECEDGKWRWFRSEPMRKEDAVKRVHELMALGYRVRLVRR